MHSTSRIIGLVLGLIALCPFWANAQDSHGWRISPEKINIRVGEDRRLQLLDDLAQELHDASWSVDDSGLAELREEDGRAVMHAKAVGTVRVNAVLGQQTRSMEVRIWPDSVPLPTGTEKWGVHPIGREIGDIPADRTANGPNLYSLEQTASGRSYLRADDDDGIQVWTWLMPEKTLDVELVCGDSVGGTLVSANHSDSFTLYAVGNDGKVRWQETIPGLRKGHTLHSGLLYLLGQSPDATTAQVTAIDELSGEHKFDLVLPPSHDTFVRSAKEEAQSPCLTASRSGARTIVSGLFGNTDGYTYLAFTENARTLAIRECSDLSTVSSGQRLLSRDDNLVLWQVHPDGTYRTTIVERSNTASGSATMAMPTGAIIPDGFDGVLLSVRVSGDLRYASLNGADEFVYRIDPDGNVIYKFRLPRYVGSLQDGMVLGHGGSVAFATRGGVLIAFEVESGKELWRWDSDTPSISVFAALANGDCLVQTPTALVEVKDSANARELMKGKFMLDSQGRMFRKNN